MIRRRKRFCRKLSLKLDTLHSSINQVAAWPPSMRKICTLARLRFELAQLESKL